MLSNIPEIPLIPLKYFGTYVPKYSVGSTDYVCNFLPKTIGLCGGYCRLKLPRITITYYDYVLRLRITITYYDYVLRLRITIMYYDYVLRLRITITYYDYVCLHRLTHLFVRSAVAVVRPVWIFKQSGGLEHGWGADQQHEATRTVGAGAAAAPGAAGVAGAGGGDDDDDAGDICRCL